MRKLSVSTGMSRPTKPTPQAKRVAPPAVPDVYRHSGSSFGSAGYSSSEDAGFLVLPDTPSGLSIRDDHSDYGSTVSKSPGVISNYIAPTQFTFPVQREPLTHKVAVFYHQQLALQEDQGIDLTQSPGRDSPGSSSGSAGSGSRHSTASLDSGRASSYLTGASIRGALSSPRCSVSSCSIGSVDRMSQRTQDYDIILDWLMELHFEEYAQCFSTAGYDLTTISRMTPEDLTAIGIKNPNHRERIKQHIDGLQMPDSLPNYVPGSIEEWLRLLRLEEYMQPILSQGYQTVRDVTQLTWEDLEDIQIVKLGHQKKILLAIKRVKDIISGKWVPPGNIHCQQQQLQQQQLRQPRGKSLESLEDPNDRTSGTHLTFSRPNDGFYCHQHIGGILPGPGQYIGPNVQTMPWRRSYDDGDITPTNEIGTDQQGGTLPRHRGGIPRSRPIAKVQGNVSQIQQQTNIKNDYNQEMMKICPTKCYGLHCASPMLGKKQPPEPPRRQCSASSVDQMSTHFDALNLSQPLYQLQHNTQNYYHHHHHPPSQPLYANYAGQTHQTTVEIHAEKAHDSKSNSSIDSIDAIPFANENAGTIKQRTLNRHDLTSSLSSSSSSSSSSATTIAGQQIITTMQLQQQQQHQVSADQLTPSPTLSNSSSNCGTSTGTMNCIIGNNVGGVSSGSSISSNKDPVGSNVLNDIGHMLANLTDELDAMLEEEKRAGLNDSD